MENFITKIRARVEATKQEAFRDRHYIQGSALEHDPRVRQTVYEWFPGIDLQDNVGHYDMIVFDNHGSYMELHPTEEKPFRVPLPGGEKWFSSLYEAWECLWDWFHFEHNYEDEYKRYEEFTRVYTSINADTLGQLRRAYFAAKRDLLDEGYGADEVNDIIKDLINQIE